MPKYKEIVAISEGLNHNGKKYAKGEIVRENVVLTEMEAKFLNDQIANVDTNSQSVGVTGCKYVLMEEPKKTEKVEGKKTYAQMNAQERAEYKKQKEQLNEKN